MAELLSLKRPKCEISLKKCRLFKLAKVLECSCKGLIEKAKSLFNEKSKMLQKETNFIEMRKLIKIRTEIK